MSGYNGWSNYETWCVALWLSNDEGYYNDTRAIIQGNLDANDGRLDPYEAASALRDYLDDLPEVEQVRETASFVSDLFGAALSEVDFKEIADNIASDLVSA